MLKINNCYKLSKTDEKMLNIFFLVKIGVVFLIEKLFIEITKKINKKKHHCKINPWFRLSYYNLLFCSDKRVLPLSHRYNNPNVISIVIYVIT